MLQSSKITQEDMANNPQAVIEVLGFYAENIVGKEKRSAPSLEEQVQKVSVSSIPELPQHAAPELKAVNVPPPPPLPPIAHSPGPIKKMNVPPPPPPMATAKTQPKDAVEHLHSEKGKQRR